MTKYRFKDVLPKEVRYNSKLSIPSGLYLYDGEFLETTDVAAANVVQPQSGVFSRWLIAFYYREKFTLTSEIPVIVVCSEIPDVLNLIHRDNAWNQCGVPANGIMDLRLISKTMPFNTKYPVAFTNMLCEHTQFQRGFLTDNFPHPETFVRRLEFGIASSTKHIRNLSVAECSICINGSSFVQNMPFVYGLNQLRKVFPHPIKIKYLTITKPYFTRSSTIKAHLAELGVQYENIRIISSMIPDIEFSKIIAPFKSGTIQEVGPMTLASNLERKHLIALPQVLQNVVLEYRISKELMIEFSEFYNFTDTHENRPFY